MKRQSSKLVTSLIENSDNDSDDFESLILSTHIDSNTDNSWPETKIGKRKVVAKPSRRSGKSNKEITDPPSPVVVDVAEELTNSVRSASNKIELKMKTNKLCKTDYSVISISDDSDNEFKIESSSKPNLKAFDIFTSVKTSINKNNQGHLSENISGPVRRSSRKQMKGKKVSLIKTQKDETIQDGYCPFCQIPFCALGIQSPNWHSMECMDLPLISSEECKNGIECDSTIPNHYRKYKHSVLARYRATKDVTSTIINEENSPTQIECETVNISSSDHLSSDILHGNSDCVLNVEDTNYDAAKCEDIFNVETPETPNFFSNQLNSENIQLPSCVESLERKLIIDSGGFFFANGEQNKLSHNKDAPSTKSSATISIQGALSIENDTTYLSQSDSFSSKAEDSLPGTAVSATRKQTSLFSFFGTKCKTTNTGGRQMKFVATDKSVKIKDESFSGLKKSKSNAKGSLKRPQNLSNNNSKAAIAPNRPGGSADSKSTQNGRRRAYCPFYKKIPDTCLTVDAFRYGDIPGCKAYILTHFHYDHYNGLTRKFKQPIYCSKITGNLVEARLKVEKQYINRLPMNKVCMVEGVEVTLRDANHCPGSVIIFMRLPTGRLILHTGDYRAQPMMEEYPELKDNQINDLYLDTTYCNPKYTFPFQQDVIMFAVKIALKAIEENPKTCIVCGTYTIGKEKVFKAIAKAVKSKICVKRDKKDILGCLEDDELSKMITLHPEEASVHVLPMKLLNFNNLCIYLEKLKQFTRILVFEPTGWTHSNKIISLDHVQPKYSRNAITHYGIPYSEHSSFYELKRFVQFLKPTRIIPTVNNGNLDSRRKMEDQFAKWLKETEAGTTQQLPKQLRLNDWMN